MKKKELPTLILSNKETGQIYQTIDMALGKEKEIFVLQFVKAIDELFNNSDIKINHKVLTHMLLNMDFENTVTTGEYFRMTLSKKTKLSKRTIQNCIYDLEKTNLIKKIATNTYVVNPSYFGKGNIHNIKKLRLQYNLINVDNEEYNLTIKYEKEYKND